MRILSLLLLIPSLAMAQPPTGQMDPQQIFEQSKQMMLPMMEESLPAMKEAKACLQKADDQSSFESCAEIMADLDKKMRARMGAMPGNQDQPMKDPKDIEWNAETKKNMLHFLDRSILIGTAMSDCFKQSSSMEQMQKCSQASMPKK
ncbi:MAG: hypothetical protein KZQ77_17955 [Candidatus Thiodiazotropha sp. (ex Notomyrtea botanica)]|nr:hypothetical protein [Candidatus Thiodiazotropha sp. (ex Notomyrtea botanica)]